LRVIAILGMMILLTGPLAAAGTQPLDSGAQATTLLDITFPPGILRSGDGTAILFAEVRMPPAYHLDARYLCAPDEVLIFLPRTGDLTIDVAGESFLLVRGAAAWQTIPAGTETTVTPGDVWLYHSRIDDDLTGVANRTGEEIRVLWAPVWVNDFACGAVHPGEFYMPWYASAGNLLEHPDSIRIRLTAISAPPQTLLASDGEGPLAPFSWEPPAESHWQALGISSGVLEAAYIPRLPGDPIEPSTIRFESGTTLAPGFLLPPTPDLRLDLISSADAPVELFHFELIFGGPDATEGPPVPIS
jgi:hypothetical protein